MTMASEAIAAPAVEAQAKAKKPRFSLGRFGTHFSLFLLVALWTLPTIGLLISSFRDADQIALSGWWTALSASDIQESSRLPTAEVQVEENGLFVIRGNLLGEDSGKTISAFGVTNATFNANPPGTSVEMRAGGFVTVDADGSYEWVSDVALEHTRGPNIYYIAELQPRFTMENYDEVVRSVGIGRAFINSLTVTLPATIIPIVIAAFAAYALAWMRFPGRTLLVVVIVGLLVVPLQMSLVPILRMYNGFAATITDLAGLDTPLAAKGYLGTWMAHIGFGLPLAIFLLRNYMVGLPKEIMESARIDGASHFKTFTTMVLPLSFPALASIAIFQFLWVWNDLLVALVFLGAQEDKTVLTGQLVNLIGSYGDEWHLLTAGAFVSIIVPLIVFFSLQRYFVRGLLAGSVK